MTRKETVDQQFQESTFQAQTSLVLIAGNNRKHDGIRRTLDNRDNLDGHHYRVNLLRSLLSRSTRSRIRGKDPLDDCLFSLRRHRLLHGHRRSQGLHSKLPTEVSKKQSQT